MPLKRQSCTNILYLANSYIRKRSFHISSTKYKSFFRWYRDFWTPKAIGPPYSHVVQVGDPVLRTEADPVPDDMIDSKDVDMLVEQMVHVLRKFNCVGLAAPQIGIPLRIIALEFKESLKDEFPKPVYEARNMMPLPLTVSSI